MPIERVGSIVTTSSSSAGTSAVVNLPANIPANSRVVIAIAITDNVTTATAPGTWAAAIASAINGVRLQTWYNYSSTPSSGGTVTITLSTSQDWVAMAACYTGAHFHGFATLTNSADLVRFASTGDGTVDTTITLNASAPIRYSGQGLGQRLAFSAVKDATTGFVSLDANTGTMSIQSEGVSSGATPVTLAWAEDTVEPPSGSWTATPPASARTRRCARSSASIPRCS